MTTIWPNKLRFHWFHKMLTKTVGASATIVDGVGIVDLRKTDHLMFGIMRYSGTAITQAEILVSENADMSSPVVLKTKTGLALDGAADQAWLEVRKDEVTQKAAEDAGATQYTTRKAYRYCAVRLTATNGDIAVVCVAYPGREGYKDQTAEVTNN